MFDAVFGRAFNSAKCKTSLRLAVSRIKLLRNKRDIQLKQMKRELAQLLQTNQEPSARIRVEHIYREQNILAAYELIELFCELIAVRLPIIESQRQCPIDLREAIASLIFAAPRCSDVPELLQVRNLLSAKYGKEFVVAAAELRPDCGVNRVVIEKLSVRAPSGEVKLKLMKDIAEDLNVNWDPSASESELLRAPEDLLEGPTHFLGASQIALETPSGEPSVVEPAAQQNQKSDVGEAKEILFESKVISMDEKQYIPFVLPVVGHSESRSQQQSTSQKISSREENDRQTKYSPLTSLNRNTSRGSDYGEDATLSSSDRAERFKDVVAAARAAAESAEHAAAAARAAALLVSKNFDRASESSSDDDTGDVTSDLEMRAPGKRHNQMFDSSDVQVANGKPLFDELGDGDEFQSGNSLPTENNFWRAVSEDHPSTAVQPVLSSSAMIGKFDDEDGSTGASFSSWNYNDRGTFRNTSFECGGAAPPRFDHDQLDTKAEEKCEGVDGPSMLRAASVNSHVHAKLPNYDELTARFEALKPKC